MARAGEHRSRPLTALALALLLAGCSSPRPSGDHGPAEPPIDVHAVPDAVPREAPLSPYGNPSRYQVFGETYQVMKDATGFRQRGLASWYGLKFHGRRTSSGEPYDMYAMTAAHKTLPLPTWVRVTNLENGRQVVVKVNDRGPFHPGRIIDLSYTAAAKLGVLAKGTAPVEIVALTSPGRPLAETLAAAQGATPAAAGDYLQLGAFRNPRNALSLQRRLERARIEPVQVHSDEAFHRVVVGPLQDDETRDRLERLVEAWDLTPRPWRRPPPASQADSSR